MGGFRFGFALVASLLALARPAPALVLGLDFAGSVTSVDPGLSAAFMVGDPASFRIEIDAETPDSDPSPTRGEYVGFSLTAEIGSYEIDGVSPGSSAVAVTNAAQDELRVSGVGLVGPDVGPFAPSILTLVLTDFTGTVFSDTQLPTSLSLGAFDSDLILVSFEDDTSQIVTLEADVTGVTVPEAAPCALLLGVALAAARSMRGREERVRDRCGL